MLNDPLLQEVDRELREQQLYRENADGVEAFDRNNEGRLGKIIRTSIVNHVARFQCAKLIAYISIC